MNKKYIIGVIVLLLVVGLGYSLSHKTAFGGTVENVPTWFYNGLSAGNNSTTGYSGSAFSVSSTGALVANGITNNGSSVATGNSTRTGNDTINGILSATQYATTAIGSSSSSPAALGAAAAGHIVVPATATTVSASSSVISANSSVFLQVEQTTPVAGTTCNTTIPTTSPVTTIVSSSTLPSINGFTVKVTNAPVTNPLCLSYHIIN